MLADEHSVLRQAQANTSPEVLFPSALAGRAALPRAATPRGHPASTLIRPCGFFAKRNRESAGVRSGAAWPRESNASPIHFRRPHRVMHRRISWLTMFRYPRGLSRPRRNRIAERLTRRLIFRWGRHCICNERTYPLGQVEHPARPAPDSKFRPTIRHGCVVGNSPDGTHGILHPSQV